MRLQRPVRATRAISIVSMIDVLMILLVFFMVTSTYMDLRMMPLAERPDAAAPAAGGGNAASLLLLVLGRDGQVRQAGRVLAPQALRGLVQARLAKDPGLAISVLPSGQAEAQALVALLDTLTLAGATQVQVLRLEAAP